MFKFIYSHQICKNDSSVVDFHMSKIYLKHFKLELFYKNGVAVVHHCVLHWNSSTTLGLIVMKVCPDIHGPMTPNDFGD